MGVVVYFNTFVFSVLFLVLITVSSASPIPSSPPKPNVEILDPSDPQLIVPPMEGDPAPSTPTTLPDSQASSGWRHGSKRILRSVVNVCQNLNQLLLKVVAKMFPWNRRARRRLKVGGSNGEDAEDEL